MHLTCAECKNQVDLSKDPELKVEDMVECQTCGMTLAVTALAEDGTVSAEIVDEGK